MAVGRPARRDTQAALARSGCTPITVTSGRWSFTAAATPCAAAFGPYMINFQAISRLLLEQGAAAQVSDSDELGRLMTLWLSDPRLRARVGEAGRRAVEANRGALPVVLQMLDDMLLGHS